MHKTIVFKMKIAIGHDKEGFKQAIINKDTKKFAELMNFSESEYTEFSAKFQRHLANFKTRYAEDMRTIENLKKRYPEQCKTCQATSPNSASAAVDVQLAKIEQASVGSMDKIQVFDENECRMNRPSVYNSYKLQEALWYAYLVGCEIGALASFQYWLIPLCLVSWAAGLIGAQCATCGCPE